MVFLPTARDRVGMCPRQGSNFLLLRQKKVTKEKATLLVGRSSGPTALRCSVFSARAEIATRLAGRAQTAARSQMWRRAVARCCKALRCSTTHQGARRAIRRLLRKHSIHASLRFGEGGPSPSSRAQRGRLVFVSPFGRVRWGRFFASFLVDTRKEVGRRAEHPARPHAVNKISDERHSSWLPAPAGMTKTHQLPSTINFDLLSKS